MRIRRELAAILLLAFLGAAGEAGAAARHTPFWACSDGKGSVFLFWLPPDGRWPAGGFLLERIAGGKASVVASGLGPGSDLEAMEKIDSADSAEIRLLAERIRKGSLTDDERNRSITVTGRNAVVDQVFGRALGVRHTDRTRGSGKVRYRLKSVSADGAVEASQESNEVDPGKRTPLPRQPLSLKAEARRDGVALYWKDPPADGSVPVVAYHVQREGPGRKFQSLTQDPLVLKRHLTRGGPDFLDAGAPRENTTYRVQSVDIFGRRSAHSQVRILKADFPAPDQSSPRVVLPPEPARDAKPAAERTPAPPASPAPAAAPPSPPKTSPSVPRQEPSAQEPGSSSGGRGPARMETIVHPPSPPETAAQEPGYFSGGRTPARMETIVHPPSRPKKGAPEEEMPPPAPPDTGMDEQTETARSLHATMPEPVENAGRTFARMETIIHPPSTPDGGEPAPGRPGQSGGSATREAEVSRDPESRDAAASSGPPTPVIVGIQGTTGTVIIEFRAGGPGNDVSHVLVIRSEYPTTPGTVVGRSVPPDARTWEDTSVAPGQNFWYRLVAVGKDGRKSPPSGPRWVRVSPR